VISKPGVMV